MLEKEIIQQCLKNLGEVKSIEKLFFNEFTLENKRKSFDGFLDLKVSNEKYHFALIVKKIIKRPFPELLKQIVNEMNDKIVIFAEYINSSIAQDLKKQNVMFFDCQGNIFLNIPNKLFIDIQGNSMTKNPSKKINALFQTKGMQLLPLLLNDLLLLNKPIRYLHRIANISFERTATSINNLKSLGFIIKTSQNKFEFSDKKKLFDKWIDNYGERLRPNLLIGTYKISPKMDIQKIAQILKNSTIDFAFGGETGAEILSQYFRAGCIDVFIPEEKTMDVIKHLGLAPSKEYNMCLSNLYSDELLFKDKSFSVPLVLPIMIYAELLFQGNDRAIETAEIIFDKYIKKMFK
ncbi:MAG: type IV toxin-antitoxin system AbiEi family antitoxin [Candidatus Celaenobacter antarcticus]|nr:type IV toxin-antitoxin system AbiEi family antitoxin [Candidatus Celaenobacter antarcticus]